MTIAVGLILSPSDYSLLPNWLYNHYSLFDHIYIAVDSVREMPIITDSKNKITIFSSPLNDDFAHMRNTLMGQNTCDWIFMLDADEVILPNLADNFTQLVNNIDDNTNIIAFSRINIKEGRIKNDYPDTQYRLVRRDITWKNRKPELGASPGYHEAPGSMDTLVLVMNDLNILHYKPLDNSFRNKIDSKEKPPTININ